MTEPDLAKALRTRQIDELTAQINSMKGQVLQLTEYSNEQSLNATYGSKYALYIDIKNAVIDTPDQFVTLYFKGFLDALEKNGTRSSNNYTKAYWNLKNHPLVLEWLKLFLKRTYLRNFDALSKKRPHDGESQIWIGRNNASYGILVTPRFKNGVWENDQSEIRHFKPKYWTVGHVLETGLVIPNENDKITFSDTSQYLSFFKNTLVRNSGSEHEKQIAEKYCDFVNKSDSPMDVPLLIPEWRYGGIDKKHEYRLDFTIINPYNLSKVGFELSPWSTHGMLTGIKDKLQSEVNKEAKDNFEKEVKKLKAYFRKFGITVLVYTDNDLANYDVLFSEMAEYLSPINSVKQLEFQVMSEFLAFGD